MRRGILLVGILALSLPVLAAPSKPTWPADVRIGAGRIDISWQSCPPGAREWEAFLSLDGGRTYSVRITPHLSTNLHAFSWPMPWLESSDPRIRLRFGDGAREREFDVEGRWTIAPNTGSPLLATSARDFAASPATGENDTAAWVDWSGSTTRNVVPAIPASAHSSSSEWRSAATARAGLPSRFPGLTPPVSRPLPRKPADQTELASAELPSPSLARLSRLNV